MAAVPATQKEPWVGKKTRESQAAGHILPFNYFSWCTHQKRKPVAHEQSKRQKKDLNRGPQEKTMLYITTWLSPVKKLIGLWVQCDLYLYLPKDSNDILNDIYLATLEVWPSMSANGSSESMLHSLTVPSIAHEARQASPGSCQVKESMSLMFPSMARAFARITNVNISALCQWGDVK